MAPQGRRAPCTVHGVFIDAVRAFHSVKATQFFAAPPTAPQLWPLTPQKPRHPPANTLKNGGETHPLQPTNP